MPRLRASRKRCRVKSYSGAPDTIRTRRELCLRRRTANGISTKFFLWPATDWVSAANPICSHEDNKRGVNIKLQVSTRERPILPVVVAPQLDQEYFKLLDFKPSAIPSLAFEEAIAEKMRGKPAFENP
jgi:hypothetical protein